jgi:hypothetical protein
MDVQAAGEASAFKREHPALQNMKFLTFSTFVCQFCPPVGCILIQSIKINADLDPQHW